MNLPSYLYNKKISLGKSLTFAEDHPTMYVVLHMLFIHNCFNFINRYLNGNKLYNETIHSKNIRVIRNYTEHCSLPITSSEFSLSLSNNKLTLSFPLIINRQNLVAFKDLEKENRKIINKWENGTLRLDREIPIVWKELYQLFTKIKYKYIKKYINKDLINQVIKDESFFKDKLFPIKTNGVVNTKDLENDCIDDPNVFADLLTSIFKLNSFK